MMGNIGIWQLLIILVIVVLLFGTKRLRTLGSDVGSAMRSFREAFSGGSEDKAETDAEEPEELADDSTERSAGQRKTGARKQKQK